jgi:hypothetical protein
MDFYEIVEQQITGEGLDDSSEDDDDKGASDVQSGVQKLDDEDEEDGEKKAPRKLKRK